MPPTTPCPHCGQTPVTDGFPCDYCRGYAHRPAQANQMPDPTAVARRKRAFREGDRVRAVHFVYDDGLRIWPIDNGPTWRVVRLQGTGPDTTIEELFRGGQMECQQEYPHATFGINDNESVPAGTEGTVGGVDDFGSVSVKWDNGRSISATVNDTLVNLSRTCKV
jgi:uncharacterized protein YodC (DUF2158 family)